MNHARVGNGSDPGEGRRRQEACGGARVALATLLVFALLFTISSTASALTLGVGWSGDPGKNGPEMPVVAKSGATTFRVPIGSGDDSLVEAAAKSGITIHAEVSTGHTLPTGTDRSNFISSVYSAVTRYGYEGSFWKQHPELPYRPITTWEVFNEPNLWGVSATSYGQFLNEVATYIQTASQNQSGRKTEVLSAGLLILGTVGSEKPFAYYGALKYLEEAYGQFGSNPNVTGVAIHPYEIYQNTFPGLTRITAFKNAVAGVHEKLVKLANGGPQKSLWITETGWAVEGPNEPVTTTEQASLLRQSVDYVRANEASLNVKDYLWYNLRDLPGEGSWDHYCGLRAHDGSFRPAWTAFQEKAGVPQIIPTVPNVGTNDASNVGSFEATLTGSVDPKGLPTEYHFEYGTTSSYGSATPKEAAGSGEGAVAKSAGIAVQPGTVYHFRLVATNNVGSSYSPDRVFYSSRAGVFFPDAVNSNSMTRWEWTTSSGWRQQFLYGHMIAAGSSPTTLTIGGDPHVFYVDAANSNTITDWTRDSTQGWHQMPLYGHQVAKGTSPVALLVNGVPHVFFVDASNNNTVSVWKWNNSTGWQQTFFYGHQVAAGTSPTAILVNGDPRVYYVDASNNNTISEWSWNSSTGWQQNFFYGHPVAAGSSPSAMTISGSPYVFFSDASNNNSVTAWAWNSSTGWQQTFLYGHPVAAGSSPAAVVNNGIPEVFFSDADNNNTITAWVWSASNGWQQAFFYGHPVAKGTSPVPTVNNNIPNVYFVDGSTNTIVDWTWNSTTGWQQTFFYGHTVSAGSSPGAF
jgi:hypothetical protein